MTINTDSEFENEKEREIIILVSNYIKCQLKETTSYYNCVIELDKLLKFLESLNIIFPPYLCTKLVRENKKLNNILKIIVHHYKVENIDIYDKINDEIKLFFVESFCLLNNIELGYLNRDDLNQYLVKLAQNNDKDAKEKIIEINQKLVIYVARKYMNRGLDLEDLIQEGNIGLLKAIEKYDETKECKFSNFAIWWIRQGITRSISNKSNTIKIPVYIIELMNKLIKIKIEFLTKYGREPTDYEISMKLGIELNKVLKIKSLLAPFIRLDAKISDDSDNTLGDFIKDDNVINPEIYSISKYLQNEILKILSLFDKKEQEIIKFRYGLCGYKISSLAEVRSQVGLTRERIRQIELKVMHKLRLCIDVKKYLDYVDNPSKATEEIYSYRKKYFFEKTSSIYKTNDFYIEHINWDDIDFLIKKFPCEDKMMLLLYLGLYDGKEYSMKSIYKKLNKEYNYKSNKYVKKLIIELIKQIENFVDQKEKKEKNKNIVTVKEEKIMGRKLKTIYELLKPYDREKIDSVIKNLPPEEKALIRLRYGDDLDNPVTNPECTEVFKKDVYYKLIPKMRKILSNLELEEIEKNQLVQSKKDTIIPIQEEKNNKDGLVTRDNEDTLLKNDSPLNNEEKQVLNKEDYISIVSIFNNPRFMNLSKTFGMKKSFILALKLGWIDEKYFSTEAIANFLDIDKLEVINITKEGLESFKQEFNSMVDEVIEVCENESSILVKKHEPKNS